MSKLNAVFSIIALLIISSFCYLSFYPLETNFKVDDQQTKIKETISLTPKCSSYEVSKIWNCTSDYEVTSVAVSADGNYMVAIVNPASVNPEHALFYFNTSAHNGRPMWIFNTTQLISSVAISADGKYIVAASQDQHKVYLLNNTVPAAGQNKEEIWYVKFDLVSEFIYSVDISADGKYIVIGGLSFGDGFILLYNNSFASNGRDKTSEKLWYYPLDMQVNSVKISADGQYVVAGTNNGESNDEVFFFNTTDFTYNSEHKPEWSFNADIPVGLIAISADGYYFVAGYEHKMYLLNKTLPDPTGKKEMWYSDWGVGPDYHIYSIDISTDGKYVVMGGRTAVTNGFIALYNNSYASTGFDKINEYLWNYTLERKINSVAITAYGEYIAVGTDKYLQEDTVFLFNNTDYTYNQEHEPEWSFNTSYDINSVSISSWGNYIGAGGLYSSSRGMTYLFYHARPLPIVPPLLQGNDDSGGNDEVPSSIPFGNHYLIFTAMGIVSLVIILKHKLFLSKK